jgi:hypothetical protein
MKRVTCLVAGLMLFAVFAAAQAPPAGQKRGLAVSMQTAYGTLKGNMTQAAEKMPEADYAFKPTPEVRPYGQLIAHVALSQFGSCAALKGEESPHKDDKEETPRSKADLVSLLKASTAYCDPLLTALTDESMVQLVKVGQNEAAKGLILAGTNTHGNEMYGTMAVYLRLKGIVPPTTERQNQQKKSQ